MKTIINENSDIKVTVEINDEKAQYLTIMSKKFINEAIKEFYDGINYNVCFSDPNNNIPIEQAFQKKSKESKLELAKLLFFDSQYIKNEVIETKVDGKFMAFNRDDCIVEIYKDRDVPNLVRNAIGILYKEKLFGKLQTNFNDIKKCEKCRAIVSLVEDACDEYWDEENCGKAKVMLDALKNLEDFNSINVALVAIDFIKNDFDDESDCEMNNVIKEVEEKLFSKFGQFGSIEVVPDCKCKIIYNDNCSCINNKEDDDEEYL